MLGLFKSKKKTSHVKVLVVDDEADIVSTVKYRLEFCEFEVVTASNGKEGLEKAASEKPDVILLDISMPVMDGHEMLARLKNSPDIKDIPVIVVSAFSDAKDIAKAAELGIADYVTKPFDFPDLMGKISKTLENKTQQ
ncbi:MAG: response regulator [Sedimentisphaerales bacterium]|nr:response regulator [Sedimentisphaerales bacterium]